jgi:hypothetical protein
MQVPDALSRCENVKADVVESPVEDDPFFSRDLCPVLFHVDRVNALFASFFCY